MLRPDIEALTDGLDAAVFGGDAFHDEEHRAYLRQMMARWEQELKLIEQGITDETDPE